MEQQDHAELYEYIVNKDAETFRSQLSEKGEYSNNAVLALRALAHAVDQDEKAARSELAKINPVVLDPESRTYYLEAELLLMHSPANTWADLQEKANEILLVNSKAVFANRVSGQVFFILGDVDKGQSHLLKLLERYPEAAYLYLDLIRGLVQNKKNKTASEYVVKIETGSRKVLYWLYLCFWYRFRFILIFLVPVLLIARATSIYSFVIFSVVGIWLLAVSLRLRELIVFRAVATFSMSIVLIFLLANSGSSP